MEKICSLIVTKLGFLFLVTLTLISSCAQVPLGLFPESASQVHKNAELLFINGDFEKALEEYETIYRTAVLPKDRNHALYGIACTQLMLATDDADFVQAIKHLLRWNNNKGSDPFTENRHLLILALQQQSELFQSKKEAQSAREEHKNRVIAFQKNKISQMAATLKSLNKQLEELETIDETFQEIRKTQ